MWVSNGSLMSWFDLVHHHSKTARLSPTRLSPLTAWCVQPPISSPRAASEQKLLWGSSRTFASDRGFPTAQTQSGQSSQTGLVFPPRRELWFIWSHCYMYKRPVAVFFRINLHSIFSVLLNMCFLNAKKGCSRSLCFSSAKRWVSVL